MNLTPKERARELKLYWINPTILEYALTCQRHNYKSEYASRYAKEYIEK